MSRPSRNTGHLSPFRYPGGKTWLIPRVRSWLATQPNATTFIEPFAGGASCGLAVANEGLAKVAVLGELDASVSAVWSVLIKGSDAEVSWLCGRIATFELTLENVRAVLDTTPTNTLEVAFRTLLHNRCSRGGLTDKRAGLLSSGERGVGLGSRWYPETLVKRINAIHQLKNLVFARIDAFELITQFSRDRDKAFFIDPPYSIGSKSAGSRLYVHHEIDHQSLFELCSRLSGSVMMTYPNDEAVVNLARQYGFSIEQIPMRSTHHVEHFELLLTKGPHEIHATSDHHAPRNRGTGERLES